MTATTAMGGRAHYLLLVFAANRITAVMAERV